MATPYKSRRQLLAEVRQLKVEVRNNEWVTQTKNEDIRRLTVITYAKVIAAEEIVLENKALIESVKNLTRSLENLSKPHQCSQGLPKGGLYGDH